jgi:protein arginine kinase activator
VLCQKCNQNIANVHIKQIVNGKQVDLYLCEQCANESNHFNMMMPFNISSFFSGFIMPESEPHYVDSASQEVVCKTCGMSFDEFRQDGKLGCAECYEVFREKLVPVFKRLHGSVGHTGKVPGKLSESINVSKEIESLRQQLDDAIKCEEYENAAKIRDRIKEIERKG